MDKDTARSIPIETVAERLGARLAKGRRYWCPVCNGAESTTPDLSFAVGSRGEYFRCWKSDATGDVFDLVKHVLGVSRFTDVMAWFDVHFGGVSEARSAPVPYRSKGKAEIVDCRESSFVSDAGADVLKAFHAAGTMSGAGAEYLAARGINPVIASGLGVRFYSDARRVLADLRERVPAESWKSSGLEAFGFFGEMLAFFYFDRGRSIRWAKGRNLGAKDGETSRRWRNLAGVRVPFPYLTWSLPWGTDRDVFVCEGETDALKQAAMGYPAIGVPGAGSWRDSWADLLRGRRVFVAGDGDEAGQKFNRAVRASLSARRIECYLVPIDPGKDLSDLT